MWKQEVIRHGMEDASLKRVVYKFVRTRLFIHVGLLVASIVLGFLGPVNILLDT